MALAIDVEQSKSHIVHIRDTRREAKRTTSAGAETDSYLVMRLSGPNAIMLFVLMAVFSLK